MSQRMTTVRSKLQTLFYELVAEGNTSNDEVIKEFERRHKKEISEAREELMKTGLRRILNDITRKTTKISANVGSTDLFGKVSGVPLAFSEKQEDGIVIKKKFGSVKIQTLIKGLSERKAQKSDMQKSNLIAALKELASKVGSDDITFDEALAKLEK